MKPYLHPAPIACLVIAVIGAVLSSLPMMIVGLIAAIGSLGLIAAKSAQSDRFSEAESLGADSRMLLRPVKKLSDDIDAILSQNKASPTIQIIGTEARQESERLVSQVTKSLLARDELKKSLRGRYEAEKEISEARMRLESAGETEKASLNAAIEARTLELGHYDQIEKNLKQIELGVNQAEAALAEMKARLAVSASGDRAAVDEGDDLRETIARMKNLSASYNEAEQMIRGSNG